MPKILIVDDRADVLEALRLLLKGAGYSSELADSPQRAIESVHAGTHDLVLIDMNYARDTTSGAEGLALLETLRRGHPEVPVIVMTAWSTIDLAVEAMRRGAADFITKPWENERVIGTLSKYAVAGRSEITPARQVQRNMLPPRRVRRAAFETDCAFLPAGEIGGDICDVFDNVFVLGDVAGKGTAAALLMANLHAAIRGNRALASDPGQLLDRVNSLFFESTSPEYYATLFLGVCESGVLRYVSCGHPSAILVRTDSSVELLESTSTVLGAFERTTFEERRIAIHPGDRVVVFSDGVTEAREEGDGWIVECVKMLVKADSRELASSLALAAANGGSDDITVLDVRFF